MPDTRVVFETASLADALTRARRIAPLMTSRTGNTAGIYMEVRPNEDEPILIRATDGEIFWDNWLHPLTVEGADTDWRMPANYITDVVSSLPIGMDKQVTLSGNARDYLVQLDAGRIKSGVPLIRGDTYPVWEPFDDKDTTVVQDLGEKLAMVSWAAARDQNVIPWSGVKFTGTHLIATDTKRFAAVPCVVDLSEPLTLPVGRFAPLVKSVGMVRVGVHRGQFLMEPDEDSQLRSTTYSKGIPDTSHIMREDYEYEVRLEKESTTDACRRIGQVAQRLGAAGIYVSMGEEELEFAVDGGPEGWARETLATPGYCQHEQVSVRVTTALFQDAISRGPGSSYVMHYDAEYEPRKPRLYFSSAHGYQVWIPELSKEAQT